MIEGASQKDFLTFMHEEIFLPLNLKQTRADKKGLKDTNVATFYETDNETYKEVYPTNNSNKWAGGGFLSTPADLVRFGNAVLNQRLFDSSTSQLLFTPVKLKNGEVNIQNYALGWRNDVTELVFKDKIKVNTLHHGGVALGSEAVLILFPEYNITVAITRNKNGNIGDLFELAYEIAELFIKTD